jgi:LPS export ABC transporter protein LptC
MDLNRQGNLMNLRAILTISTEKKHSVLFALRLIVFGLYIVSCQSKVSSDIPPEILEKKVVPTLDAVNFETTFNDSGIVVYHLKAPRVLFFPARKNPNSEAYYEFPKGFLVQKYDQNRKIESEMSGNYGKCNETQQKWYASGNVIMINSKGDTLRTEELNYDRTKDLIYSDRFVSIKKNGQDDITGTGGFKSNSQMTNWAFMKTQGHVYVEDQ